MPESDNAYFNQLLDEVLALPAQERAQYLHAHCDDLEIRKKIMELAGDCEQEIPDIFLQPAPERTHLIKMIYHRLKAGASGKKGPHDDS